MKKIKKPFLFTLYYALLTCLTPFLHIFIHYRKYKNKEDPQRYQEKFGIYSKKRPEGILIWFHVASLGEAISIKKLVDTLITKFNVQCLITSGTKTSAKWVMSNFSDNVIHQFFPIDSPFFISKFHRHWKPNIAFFVESEFWPNLLYLTKKNHIPLFLINARLSEKSFLKWKKFPNLSHFLLNHFECILAQSQKDLERLKSISMHGDISCLGNLKLDSDPLSYDKKKYKALKKDVDSRFVWVAASTHKDEDIYFIQAHQILQKHIPDILLILVPRHPERGLAIFEECQKRLVSTLRTEENKISPKVNIYIADTIGELGLFYRLSKIVCIGGSFIPHGGQNFIQAAQLDNALIFGPHMFNFQEIADEFLKQEAALQTSDSVGLADHIMMFRNNPSHYEKFMNNAKIVMEQKSNIVNNIIEKVKPYIENV